MSSAFEYAVEHTLTKEGVWSDHAQDRGGKTKYGITFSVAIAHGLRVEDLTVEQAKAIYEEDYWDKLQLDAIRSRWVAAEIFDTAVNMGLHQAAMIAQRAANLLLPAASIALAVDGVFGIQTRAALNALAASYHRQLLAALNGFQFVTYLDIQRARPLMADAFIRGWMRRLEIPNDAPERA